ncbi:MAG: PQQ-binding-like beta-propeller repeat protein, partial [Bacteroidales bacterium]|nr:PQQ-binding-like beta-propeller repeat protein [Bacteroidales bacterium]
MKMKFGIIGLLLLTATSVCAQDVHGWRGPNRDGIYPETGLLKEWPAQGPALKWETSVIGKGYSSPVIVDNRLYITGMDEEQTHEVFYCFDLQGQL